VLSIGLTNEEYADEAVRTPLVPAACRYLRRAVQGMAGEPATAAAACDGAAAAAPPAPEAAAAGGEGPEVAAMRRGRLLAALRCLMCTGEYVESLGPFLQYCGVDTVCALLRHVQRAAAGSGGAAAAAPAPGGGPAGAAAPAAAGWLMHEALQVVCSLLAHRKFAELLVEAGGVQLLLALPRCAARGRGRRGSGGRTRTTASTAAARPLAAPSSLASAATRPTRRPHCAPPPPPPSTTSAGTSTPTRGCPLRSSASPHCRSRSSTRARCPRRCRATWSPPRSAC
jgi:hypothetical protein